MSLRHTRYVLNSSVQLEISITPFIFYCDDGLCYGLRMFIKLLASLIDVMPYFTRKDFRLAHEIFME